MSKFIFYYKFSNYYKGAIFQMKKVAVLTNDLQYDLVLKNEERIEAVKKATPKFCEFLSKMRELNVPIVHLQLINREDDPTVEKYNGVVPVTKGSKGAEIMEEFLAPTDILIEKNKDSGFFETTLDEKLKEMSIESVIITGMQTQICVQTTAADAFFRGYKVIVPEDGVVSARDEDKQRALEWLDNYFAQVTTSDEIIKYLQEHDDFERKEVKIP